MGTRDALITTTRVTLALVFVAAAAAKLLLGEDSHSHSGSGFEELLRSDWLRHCVSVVELSTACLLVSRSWRVGLDLSVLLAIGFLAVLLGLLLLDVPVSSCGCIGSIPIDLTTHALLAFGIGGAALLAGLIARTPSP